MTTDTNIIPENGHFYLTAGGRIIGPAFHDCLPESVGDYVGFGEEGSLFYDPLTWYPEGCRYEPKDVLVKDLGTRQLMTQTVGEHLLKTVQHGAKAK